MIVPTDHLLELYRQGHLRAGQGREVSRNTVSIKKHCAGHSLSAFPASALQGSLLCVHHPPDLNSLACWLPDRLNQLRVGVGLTGAQREEESLSTRSHPFSHEPLR